LPLDEGPRLSRHGAEEGVERGKLVLPQEIPTLPAPPHHLAHCPAGTDFM